MPIYEHTQPGTAMRVGLGGVLAVIVITTLVRGDGQPSVWLVAAGIAVLLVLHHSLTVRVDAEQVTAAFGPGVIKRSIPVSAILGASVGRCAWYNGWGTRLTSSGWMYRVSGMDTVDLTLASGGFRIGTNDPQGLLAAIEQARRRAGVA